ncbi:hypothetical protein OS493_025298 [Desmophyllum pertusum]|uniref:Uncharacterized protein n=1 Tax=Desmophyllum pertusum TaxID=174260 RepID=A0A9X0CVW2_9CNID|nr:hypothetical protein OS493_025298 [Desmophyllum pertusum]
MDAKEMDESGDKPEVSQPPKPKLMDPGKYAFVEKYLEDDQERHSVTTETSDSGLGTHAAAPELGMEEISALFPGLSWAYLSQIKEFFPDTTVGVLKECFVALQLYDFAELLEKVRPRSLRPALSPEQIEQLRGSSDRPTKYHNKVAVLVVKHIVGKYNVERVDVEKIEAFFKDLNSRNEVTIIAPPPCLHAVWRMENQLKSLEEEKKTRYRLEIELLQQRESLEKTEMQLQKESTKRCSF